MKIGAFVNTAFPMFQTELLETSLSMVLYTYSTTNHFQIFIVFLEIFRVFMKVGLPPSENKSSFSTY